MSFTRRRLLHASALSVGAALVPLPARAEQMVRIAVGRFRDPLVVEGGERLIVRGGDGEVLGEQAAARLSCDARGIVLGKARLATDVVRLASPTTLTLRGHSYRRFLEVSWRSYRGEPELLVVHPLPLETYVLGVVSSELPRLWPLEGLKVQAIAARTYAVWQKYRRLELPYHMESTVLDQVYHGAQREHEGAERAVGDTAGKVLTHERRVVEAYFHSACGGHTESAEEGWGRPVAYLPGSECGFCGAATRFRWREQVARADVDKAFAKLLGEPVVELRVLAKTRTGRVKHLLVAGASRKQRITGGDLRRLVGYDRVWSTQIDAMEATPSSFVFAGRGAGHAVGMCQWGARGMAEAGHAYDVILARYYPGARLSKMY